MPQVFSKSVELSVAFFHIKRYVYLSSPKVRLQHRQGRPRLLQHRSLEHENGLELRAAWRTGLRGGIKTALYGQGRSNSRILSLMNVENEVGGFLRLRRGLHNEARIALRVEHHVDAAVQSLGNEVLWQPRVLRGWCPARVSHPSGKWLETGLTKN